MGIVEEIFVEPTIQEDSFCAICHDVAYPPVETSCNHIFCKSCITEWLKFDNTCPLDRKENPCLLESTEKTNRILEHKVYCEYRCNGCQFEGSLNEYIENHKQVCEYIKEACVYCFKLILRKDFTVCKLLLKFIRKKDHIAVCTGYNSKFFSYDDEFETCGVPHCGHIVRRQDLEHHMKYFDYTHHMLQQEEACSIL